MKYLLDVNLLIAAIWQTHVSHSQADSWVRGKRLVTCAITELGFLRISTHPKALNSDMAGARRLLESFLVTNKVEFCPSDLSALKSRPTKSDRVTDAYLADLAASKGMKLATLDQNIAHSAVELIT